MQQIASRHHGEKSIIHYWILHCISLQLMSLLSDEISGGKLSHLFFAWWQPYPGRRPFSISVRWESERMIDCSWDHVRDIVRYTPPLNRWWWLSVPRWKWYMRQLRVSWHLWDLHYSWGSQSFIKSDVESSGRRWSYHCHYFHPHYYHPSLLSSLQYHLHPHYYHSHYYHSYYYHPHYYHSHCNHYHTHRDLGESDFDIMMQRRKEAMARAKRRRKKVNYL